MSDIETGGPAFPRDHAQEGHNGMDLRDYFAAKAMQGFIAQELRTQPYESANAVAVAAYRLADAMLAARAAK